ncbi:hypothetical protein GH733_015376 [Mirounga leonina]|nr:hypothetical protein GH733_015376 [Mirounga leonina]
MEKFEELVEKYPCTFPCWVGPFQAFFYIYDPDYAKIFLGRTDAKSKYLYKFLIPCLGKGLVSLDRPKWFQDRELLTPAFNVNILKSYVEVMAHSVNTMLCKWEKICSSQDTVVEVYEHINLMTLGILLKRAFSQETNCQISSTHDLYVKTKFEARKIIFYHLHSFLHHHDIIFKFSPQGQRLQEMIKILQQYTEKVIQDRKKFLKDEKKHGNTQKQKYQDFLDIILSAQELLWFSVFGAFTVTLPSGKIQRNCIGQHFAMIELKVAIALILLRFKVAPDPTRPLVFLYQIVLKAKNGVHLHLKKLS